MLKSLRLLLGVSVTVLVTAAPAAPLCRQVFVEKKVSKKKLVPREVESLRLNLSEGRLVYFQYVAPAQKGTPTILMLPGANRGTMSSDQAFQHLAGLGFGVATMNSSAHPFSIGNLKEGVQTKADQLTLQDFAIEVERLADYLKSEKGAGQVIPVSLSHSGAYSALLKKFPLVIDGAPLTSSKADEPQLDAYIRNLRAGEMWNPIFGPGITRNLLDAAYRSTWTAKVDEMIKDYGVAASRREDLLDGYVAISRVVERFEWKDLETDLGTRRVFMLAGEEAVPLLKDQLETFLFEHKRNPKTTLVLLLESQHAIPIATPEAYAMIVKLAADGTLPEGGAMTFKASTNETQIYSSEGAVELAKQLLKTIEK